MNPSLSEKLASQQIKFNFNPPNALHFGGSWEREVRSIKSALCATLGAQTVTEEVLRTVLVEVEGILNSRALGYVSADVADPDPITPNTLLVGWPDSALPQVVYPELELLSRWRWRQSQALTDRFWEQLIRHFLPSLQARQKWQQDNDDLKVGSVILIIDQQSPRALWLTGRVKAVFPGADGHVRSAEVQVKDKTYTRPVARLIHLPPLPEDTPSQ